jgi:soluble lytic murein transglycosylase-like protein
MRIAQWLAERARQAAPEGGASVIRCWLLKPVSLCLMAGMSAAAVPARGDVMQIEPAGAVWVAGGPVAPAQYSPSLPEEGGDLPAGASSHPVTLVSTTAGPREWQARVAELSAKYDLSPSLIEALVWQESRWRTGAVSPVGARGLAQLMPGTARQLGVDANDPHANLEGGARYLRMQLDAFGGDLEKALAAYNAGPGRVVRAGGIPPIRETRDYVAAILGRLSAPVRR